MDQCTVGFGLVVPLPRVPVVLEPAITSEVRRFLVSPRWSLCSYIPVIGWR